MKLDYQGESHNIKRCFKCGSRKLSICEDENELIYKYWVKCKKCGYESRRTPAVSASVHSWNIMRL